MTIQRMDNVLLVVDDLEAVKAFFIELGLIELDKFHTPSAVRFGPVNAPVNALGFRRVMFAVDEIDEVVARMLAHGAELIGEMRYEDSYRLAYIRGPEGIIVALSEAL